MRELNEKGKPKLSFIVDAPPAVIIIARENKNTVSIISNNLAIVGCK